MTNNKHTVSTRQAQQDSDSIPVQLSSITRHAMRFYDVDDRAIVELRKAIAHVSDDTFKDIIRKAVHAGLPVIQKQWEPIIKSKE